jgi:hypothetical protein
MRSVLFALMTTLGFSSAFADVRLVTSAPTSVTDKFFEETLKLLPPAFHQEINSTVSVEFVQLDTHPSLQDPCTPRENHQVYGKFQGGKIYLNRNFLPHLRGSNVTGFSCGHKTYKKLATATLLHELAHLFDEKTQISKTIHFRSLIGAVTKEGGVGKLKNRETSRSADSYELKNPSESFAINTEFFLLDQEFACRRPNLSSFLGLIYGARKPSCNPASEIRVLDGAGKTFLTDIKPENVREIQYLFAGKGAAVMSRFGHAMFKIVMNPPAQDLVAGFVGMIDDTVINSLDGLTGEYPSRLVVGPYTETLNKYTRVEMRDLTGYPIAFSAHQKRVFLQQVLTLYWEYAGRYFFISNNCATEAMDLLKTTIVTNDFQKKRPLTPKGVLEALEATGLVSKEKAITNASHWTIMERIFERTQIKNRSLKDYWKLPALQRRELINGDKTALRSFHALEKSIAERDLRSMEGRLMKEIHKLPEGDATKTAALESIRLNSILSFGHQLATGYGIPIPHDRRVLTATEEGDMETALAKAQQEMGTWGQSMFGDSEEALEARASFENETIVRKLLTK